MPNSFCDFRYTVPHAALHKGRTMPRVHSNPFVLLLDKYLQKSAFVVPKGGDELWPYVARVPVFQYPLPSLLRGEMGYCAFTVSSTH